MKTEIIDQLVFEHSQYGPIKEDFKISGRISKKN